MRLPFARHNRLALAFTLLLSMGGVVGCAYLGETEAPAPQAQVGEKLGSGPSCDATLPASPIEWNDFVANEAAMIAKIDCVQSQLDQAFSSIRTRHKNTLSIQEIQKAIRIGVVSAQNLAPENWDNLGIALSALNSEGKPEIRKADLDQILAALRDFLPKFSKTLKKWTTKNLERPAEAPHELIRETLLLGAEGVRLLPKLLKGPIGISARGFPDMMHVFIRNMDPRDWKVLETRLTGIWQIAHAAAPLDETRENVRGEVSVPGILKITEMGARFLEVFASMIPPNEVAYTDWFGHAEFSHSLSRALSDFESTCKDFIEKNSFATLRSTTFIEAVRDIGDMNPDLDLLTDLTKIFEKVGIPRERGTFHFSVILPFAHALRLAGDDIIQAKSLILSDPTIAQAERDPLLRRVVWKGSTPDIPLHAADRPARRSLLKVDRSEMVSRLIARRLTETVFNIFDREGKGKIKIGSGDSNDISRLSNTLAWAMDALNPERWRRREKGDSQKHIPAAITSKFLGLIGDRWLPDGDRDGAIDADELYGVVALIQEVQRRGKFWFSDAAYAKKETDPYPGEYADFPNNLWGLVFRPGAIANLALPDVLGTWAWISPQINELSEEKRESLWHGLIDQPSEIRELVGNLPPYRPFKGREFIPTNQGVLPAAVVIAIDRLMARCDQNEDGQLTGVELDCALPLISQAGDLIVNSGMIVIQPGPHDLAQWLFGALVDEQPAVQLIAKILLSQGSLIPNEKTAEVVFGEFLDAVRRSRWDKLIAAFTQGLSRNWEAEFPATAKLRKSGIPSPSDLSHMSPQQLAELASWAHDLWTEWQILKDRIHLDWKMGLAAAFSIDPRLIQWFMEIQSTKNQAQVVEALTRIFHLRLGTNPTLILSLTEEIVRRREPLCHELICNSL